MEAPEPQDRDVSNVRNAVVNILEQLDALSRQLSAHEALRRELATAAASSSVEMSPIFPAALAAVQAQLSGPLSALRAASSHLEAAYSVLAPSTAHHASFLSVHGPALRRLAEGGLERSDAALLVSAVSEDATANIPVMRRGRSATADSSSGSSPQTSPTLTRSYQQTKSRSSSIWSPAFTTVPERKGSVTPTLGRHKVGRSMTVGEDAQPPPERFAGDRRSLALSPSRGNSGALSPPTLSSPHVSAEVAPARNEEPAVQHESVLSRLSARTSVSGMTGPPPQGGLKPLPQLPPTTLSSSKRATPNVSPRPKTATATTAQQATPSGPSPASAPPTTSESAVSATSASNQQSSRAEKAAIAEKEVEQHARDGRLCRTCNVRVMAKPCTQCWEGKCLDAVCVGLFTLKSLGENEQRFICRPCIEVIRKQITQAKANNSGGGGASTNADGDANKPASVAVASGGGANDENPMFKAAQMRRKANGPGGRRGVEEQETKAGDDQDPFEDFSWDGED